MLIQNFLFHRILGEVKVLIQNFLFHHVLDVVKIRQVFHLERVGGQYFTNISCFIIKSHHVMMTFLVFDLDVLFIPCYYRPRYYLGLFCFCYCYTLLLKDSNSIGIFYCFSTFGTILNIIKRFQFHWNLLLFFYFRYYP